MVQHDGIFCWKSWSSVRYCDYLSTLVTSLSIPCITNTTMWYLHRWRRYRAIMQWGISIKCHRLVKYYLEFMWAHKRECLFEGSFLEQDSELPVSRQFSLHTVHQSGRGELKPRHVLGRPCRRRSELWQEKQQHVRTAFRFMAAPICYLSLRGSAASKWAYICKSVFLQVFESTLLLSVAVTNQSWCILWMLNVWLSGQRHQTGCCCWVRSPLTSVCLYRLVFLLLSPFFILVDMHKLVVLSLVIAVSAECCFQIP